MPAPKPIKIPYDSFVLSAVVAEMQQFVGGKVQRISQPDEHTLGLGIYAGGSEGYLLLNCHPQFARVHLITKRPSNQPQPLQFCTAVRSRADGARITFARQIGFDRVLHIGFHGAEGDHTLIAELMGKHSNLILIDSHSKVVAAAKWVGRTMSSRPIQANTRYEPPPFPPRPPLTEAKSGQDYTTFTGASPFLLRLFEADPGTLERVKTAVREERYEPVISPGHGAYPISVAALGVEEFRRAGISIALEQHYDASIPESEAQALRSTLLNQLQRVLLAREVALQDLFQARDAGDKANRQQLMGELILAYGNTLEPGAAVLDTVDYEGNPIAVKLDPELGFKDNANRYFEKAKKAKGRLGFVREQIERLEADKQELESLIGQVESETRRDALEEMQQAARAKRWLHTQPLPTRNKEERPYQGHRIREVMGPGGVVVLYGENAESNDYLTLRVAKPNDWWLHVRGSVSAHVVIVTRNQPEKVGREAMLFAAKVAVLNSPSKHAGYVPVDYTLKKYVRKPRGAATGAALYTHEKTLHVES